MRRILGICAALMMLVATVLAGLPAETTDQILAAATLSVDRTTFIDGNNILMFMSNRGVFGRDLSWLFRNTVYPYGTWWPFDGDTAAISDNTGGAANHCVQCGAGLWIGGYIAGDLQATVTSNYYDEYTTGPMFGGNYLPDDPSFRVYKLYSDSLASNPNDDYLNWPVDQGAPVDGEGNPAILGDLMLWAVFNDADPTRHTVNGGKCPPMGIEIQQTMWVYNSADEDTANTVFIRYKLYNSGGNNIQDCYLTIFADMDIGDYDNDLAGCDTLSDIFYAYNGAAGDPFYSPSVPPAAGYRIIKGPIVPEPESTAYFDGYLMPGYMNLGLTNFKSHGSGYMPGDSLETYNYMRGLTDDGLTLESGTVFDFPGDPDGEGFCDYDPGDRIMMGSCGPFDFNAGDSQYVLIAFACASGVDNYNSVTELRNTLNSFNDFQVGIEDGGPIAELPDGYKLGQNYPNPFNPSTTIEYSLPRNSEVRIDVFNVLGQRVRELVNETQPAGNHSVVWDGADDRGQQVSSGFYLYRITAGDYKYSRKMLMLK